MVLKVIHYGPYTLLGLKEDMVYSPNFVVHVVVKVGRRASNTHTSRTIFWDIPAVLAEGHVCRAVSQERQPESESRKQQEAPGIEEPTCKA